jgi:hypothetical protein
VTATVIAAIPNSDSGIITACSANSDGAMRVIDAQNNATCSNTETQLSWSAAQTAIAKFDYDASDPYSPGVYNSMTSRNIAAYKRVDTDDFSGYCIHLNFTPRYASQSQFSLYDVDVSNRDMVTSDCGTGYEFLVLNTASSTPSGAIFFSE